MNYEEIEKIAKQTLSEKRFRHCQGVAKRAVELARIYGEDEEIARKIGIAHDIAKEMPKEEALQYAKDYNIQFDKIEQQQPGLWHSKIGAHFVMKEFGFTNDMAQAILYHTTGNIHMNTIDKIIYVADKTDETRTIINLKEAVEISNHNLNEGVLYIAKFMMQYSLQKDSLIHTDTVYLVNQLLLQKQNKKEVG